MGRERRHERMIGVLLWLLIAALIGLAIWALHVLPYFSRADLF